MYPYLPSNPKTKKLEIPDDMVDEHGMVQVGGGSGFLVDASGIIVTNKHVISDPKAEYTVLTNEGEKYAATVVSYDAINDVAVLKIEGHGTFPTLTLGDSGTLQLGQSVIAIGTALGVFKNTVSTGIVSGLSRSISAPSEKNTTVIQELRGLIQTDAAINPGNSGGPLVDSAGFVIGINAAIIYGAQSIGLAIPINAAKRDLHDIRQFGRIRRPFLGVRYLILDETLASKLKVPIAHGALVMKEGPHDHAIIPGSPAAGAGIRMHDILLEANGKKITGDYTIQDLLEDMEVGDTVEFLVLRKGKEITLTATLAERQ
jgi:S1-C subfamily serine protease